VTLRITAPRAKSRWLTLFVLLVTLTVVGAGFALAHSGLNSIPARYAGGTTVDNYPTSPFSVNDAPGQVDMTQMGRDTSVNPNVRIFWSWDSISAWTGKGQTGDACALFDTADPDANINFVICARVSNTNADPDVTEILPASADHPAYLFDCSNAKNDRCTQPTPRIYNPGQVLAGPLAATQPPVLTQSGAGNLQTDTDPFAAGEANPHDTSIEIEVLVTLVPSDVALVNVCSYPSAGNGGNNNPFDCINNPGATRLTLSKTVVNTNGGTKVASDFTLSATATGQTTVSGTAGTSTTSLTGSYGPTNIVGNVEYTLSESGGGTAYTAGTWSCSGTGVTWSSSTPTKVTVAAGGSATCSITNTANIAAPSIASVMKWTLNDRLTLTGYRSGGGGTSKATFTLYKDASGVALCDASTQVFTETVNVIDSGTDPVPGTAATTTGYTTEVAGTYRWIAAYLGNAYNAAISTPCTGAGSEVTQLP
jgi:hypothetical protein